MDLVPCASGFAQKSGHKNMQCCGHSWAGLFPKIKTNRTVARADMVKLIQLSNQSFRVATQVLNKIIYMACTFMFYDHFKEILFSFSSLSVDKT